jgi:hypothetical protein
MFAIMLEGLNPLLFKIRGLNQYTATSFPIPNVSQERKGQVDTLSRSCWIRWNLLALRAVLAESFNADLGADLGADFRADLRASHENVKREREVDGPAKTDGVAEDLGEDAVQYVS